MLLPLGLVVGCAGFQKHPTANSSEQILSQARGPEQNKKLYTDLIRELIDQGKLYAAYAHLQEQERLFGGSEELKLLRSEIQRKLGRTAEAEAGYKALLDTPYKGYAEHGLGLIYAPQNLALGTKYLRRAVKILPTDARIRNDLGYALMRQGKLADAHLELATAFQLDNGSNLSRNNFILVQLLQGNEAGARRVAEQTEIPPKQMAQLRKQAAELNASGVEPVTTTPIAATNNSPVVGGGGG